jgi:hypothetical protein
MRMGVYAVMSLLVIFESVIVLISIYNPLSIQNLGAIK